MYTYVSSQDPLVKLCQLNYAAYSAEPWKIPMGGLLNAHSKCMDTQVRIIALKYVCMCAYCVCICGCNACVSFTIIQYLKVGAACDTHVPCPFDVCSFDVQKDSS